MNETDYWLIRYSFPISIQRLWEFQVHRQSDFGKWWCVIDLKLDIPALTEQGIQLKLAFNRVNKLDSSSMIKGLMLIKILILLIDSFDNGVIIYERSDGNVC